MVVFKDKILQNYNYNGDEKLRRYFRMLLALAYERPEFVTQQYCILKMKILILIMINLIYYQWQMQDQIQMVHNFL